MKAPAGLKILVLLITLTSLPGLSCGSKQARYYMLSSNARPAPVSTGGEAFTVGVGPVKLPDYLMRPQIVTRETATEVRMAEFDRWAEPLNETMTRVLAEHLSVMLPDVAVLIYPWRHADAPDYRVKVNVTRFELDPDGRVHLEADWSISDGQGGILGRERGMYAEPVVGEGFDAIVSAMNTALARLSESIAQSISG